LDKERKDLVRMVGELKAKLERVEKREIEQKSIDDRKHLEEISLLKKTNAQLKVSVSGLIFDAIGRNLGSNKRKLERLLWLLISIK
jgi:Axonemal dynein light chain